MPGNILTFECSCGLRGKASPGGTYNPANGEVVDFTAAWHPAERRIHSVRWDDLDARGLVAIRDPFVGEDRVVPGPGAEMHLVDCPACGNPTMAVRRTGLWD
jgi:hypothetical protein